MEENRRTFKILTGTLTGKKLLGRPKRTWEHNIGIHFEQIGQRLLINKGLINFMPRMTL